MQNGILTCMQPPVGFLPGLAQRHPPLQCYTTMHRQSDQQHQSLLHELVQAEKKNNMCAI
jgi:hypothetical protein